MRMTFSFSFPALNQLQSSFLPPLYQFFTSSPLAPLIFDFFFRAHLFPGSSTLHHLQPLHPLPVIWSLLLFFLFALLCLFLIFCHFFTIYTFSPSAFIIFWLHLLAPITLIHLLFSLNQPSPTHYLLSTRYLPIFTTSSFFTRLFSICYFAFSFSLFIFYYSPYFLSILALNPLSPRRNLILISPSPDKSILSFLPSLTIFTKSLPKTKGEHIMQTFTNLISVSFEFRVLCIFTSLLVAIKFVL